MRVAYVLSQNKGGLPHYAAELSNAVAEHADVWVLKPTETTADDAFSDDVTVVNLFEGIDLSVPDVYDGSVDVRETLQGIASYRALRRIREIDPDVVHDPTDLFPHVKFFARLYGIDREYPFVVTKHEVPENPFSLATPEVLAESVVEAAIPDLDVAATVVHTDQQRDALLERGHSADRVTVIPHGVYDFFTRYDHAEPAREDHTVLFFGNVTPAKGVGTLVEAISHVARELPDVRLVIAGDGRLSGRTRRIIAAHPERYEVHNRFVPNERVGELFCRASLVALPYHDLGDTKGQSGALSTAYSFGKPVVATATGDFPAMVGDRNCGLLVPPDDPEALAAAVVDVLSDPGRRDRLAVSSERAARDLTWSSLAERYIDLYEEISGERPAGRRAVPLTG